MDFSIIFALVWKIVYSILRKEGVFDETMGLDLPGMTTTPTDTTTTTQTTTTTTDTGSGMPAILESLLGRIQ